MVMAADMSYRLGWIEESLLQRTRALMEKAKLPTAPPKVGLNRRLGVAPRTPEKAGRVVA